MFSGIAQDRSERAGRGVRWRVRGGAGWRIVNTGAEAFLDDRFGDFVGESFAPRSARRLPRFAAITQIAALHEHGWISHFADDAEVCCPDAAITRAAQR